MNQPTVKPLKKSLPILIAIFLLQTASAQEYVGQKSFVGVTFGTITYQGIYSKDASYISHTSLSISGYYSHRIALPTQLYLRGELMLGELAGNNTKENESSNPLKGEFRGYALEASIKGEYELLNLHRYVLSPYVTGGVGSYVIFDYEAKPGGNKPLKDRVGFVVPIGAGVKYRFNNRIKLFAEGNYRFFNKNLDNYPDKNVSNTNRYYTIVLGASFALNKKNRLW